MVIASWRAGDDASESIVTILANADDSNTCVILVFSCADAVISTPVNLTRKAGMRSPSLEI